MPFLGRTPPTVKPACLLTGKVRTLKTFDPYHHHGAPPNGIICHNKSYHPVYGCAFVSAQYIKRKNCAVLYIIVVVFETVFSPF